MTTSPESATRTPWICIRRTLTTARLIVILLLAIALNPLDRITPVARPIQHAVAILVLAAVLLTILLAVAR